MLAALAGESAAEANRESVTMTRNAAAQLRADADLNTFAAGNGNQKRDLCGHVKWDPQVLRQNIKFWALLAKECSWSRLRNSWGFRLGAVLNSPGEHPFALDRRLDAGSGGPAARREVEVGLFRRVADRAPGHGWVTDAHRAPKGRCRRCAGYVTRRTSWSAVSASTPNMQ